LYSRFDDADFLRADGMITLPWRHVRHFSVPDKGDCRNVFWTEPYASVVLIDEFGNHTKVKAETALLAPFLRTFAKADAGSATVLDHSTRSSLFYRNLHGRYGCRRRRKFILDNFPNHLVRNGVIFVPKYVPNAGDAAPTDVCMHAL
jgi:hypothetical protein